MASCSNQPPSACRKKRHMWPMQMTSHAVAANLPILSSSCNVNDDGSKRITFGRNSVWTGRNCDNVFTPRMSLALDGRNCMNGSFSTFIVIKLNTIQGIGFWQSEGQLGENPAVVSAECNCSLPLSAGTIPPLSAVRFPGCCCTGMDCTSGAHHCPAMAHIARRRTCVTILWGAHKEVAGGGICNNRTT